MRKLVFVLLLTIPLSVLAKDKKLKATVNPTGPPSVALSWVLSTSSGVTSQKLFRGTTPGGESTTPITTISNGTTNTYTDADATLVRGTTYYYTVCACISTSCSNQSNEASALIPNIPNAPTGLTATPQ